jgi:hypothetical protein
LSIVGVVVGTVAGEVVVVVARQRSQKFEVFEIRYSPTTKRLAQILAKPQASTFLTLRVLLLEE